MKDFILSLNHEAEDLAEAFCISEEQAEKILNRLNDYTRKVDCKTKLMAAIAPTCETLEELSFCMVLIGIKLAKSEMRNEEMRKNFKQHLITVMEEIDKEIQKEEEKLREKGEL